MSTAGESHYELGDIRRRMGDIDGAREAFGKAREFGFDPLPSEALWRCQLGEDAAAWNDLRMRMDAEHDEITRLRLLPAAIEIALARDRVDDADQCCREPEESAERFDSPGFRAWALHARGAVLVKQGAPATARAVSTGAASAASAILLVAVVFMVSLAFGGLFRVNRLITKLWPAYGPGHQEKDVFATCPMGQKMQTLESAAVVGSKNLSRILQGVARTIPRLERNAHASDRPRRMHGRERRDLPREITESTELWERALMAAAPANRQAVRHWFPSGRPAANA